MKPEYPEIRTPYTYDKEKNSDECANKTIGPSLTVQSMAVDADLNVMLKRFGVTGKDERYRDAAESRRFESGGIKSRLSVPAGRSEHAGN